MEEDYTEFDITQPAIYFIAPERRHSRWRPGPRRHALCRLHEAGAAEDEDVELIALTPPAVCIVKSTPPAIHIVKPAPRRTRMWSSSP